MEYYVQFYSRTDANGNLIESCGSDAIFILDGRNNLPTMIEDAHKRAKLLSNVHKIIAFCIMRGNLKKFKAYHLVELDKKPVYVQPTQEELHQRIADKAGLDVLTCCSCGAVFYAERNDHECSCPHCGFEANNEDHSDLFYDGWNDENIDEGINEIKSNLIADLATSVDKPSYQFYVEEINAIENMADLKVYQKKQDDLK